MSPEEIAKELFYAIETLMVEHAEPDEFRRVVAESVHAAFSSGFTATRERAAKEAEEEEEQYHFRLMATRRLDVANILEECRRVATTIKARIAAMQEAEQ